MQAGLVAQYQLAGCEPVLLLIRLPHKSPIVFEQNVSQPFAVAIAIPKNDAIIEILNQVKIIKAMFVV